MLEPRDHPGRVHDLHATAASVDVADAVAQGVRAGLGLVVDAARVSGRVAATGVRITTPLLNFVLWPPLAPRRLQPGYGVQVVMERLQRDLHETLGTLGRWSATALPGAVDTALDQVDVERVVTVVLDRIKLDALVTEIVRRLDLDTIAGTAMAQLDLAPVVSVALDQLDLTQLVVDRVDLERVVTSALERLDLTAIVVDQVDLGSVVAAALQRVDLTQIVLQQVDLIGVAEYVVEGIDLPEIIRDSTGSVASGAVVGLRMQGIDADTVVERVVDKMLRRRRKERADGAPDALSSANAPPDTREAKPV